MPPRVLRKLPYGPALSLFPVVVPDEPAVVVLVVSLRVRRVRTQHSAGNPGHASAAANAGAGAEGVPRAQLVEAGAVVEVVHRVVHALVVDVPDVVPLARCELGREALAEGLRGRGPDGEARVRAVQRVCAPVGPRPRGEEEREDGIRGAGDDVPGAARRLEHIYGRGQSVGERSAVEGLHAFLRNDGEQQGLVWGLVRLERRL